MIRKIGLEADSRLRYAIITIHNISDNYYTAFYCRFKHNVLISPKKLSGTSHLHAHNLLRTPPSKPPIMHDYSLQKSYENGIHKSQGSPPNGSIAAF